LGISGLLKTGGTAEGVPGEVVSEATFTTPSGLGQSAETIEAATRSGKKRDSRRDGLADFAGENCFSNLEIPDGLLRPSEFHSTFKVTSGLASSAWT